MRRQRIDALPKRFGGKWGWRGWCGSCLRRSMLASPGGDWPYMPGAGAGTSLHLGLLIRATTGMPRVNHMHLRGKDARFESDISRRPEGDPPPGAALQFQLADHLPDGGAEVLTQGHAHGHRSEEHTSELQSLRHLVCRLL